MACPVRAQGFGPPLVTIKGPCRPPSTPHRHATTSTGKLSPPLPPREREEEREREESGVRQRWGGGDVLAVPWLGHVAVAPRATDVPPPMRREEREREREGGATAVKQRGSMREGHRAVLSHRRSRISSCAWFGPGGILASSPGSGRERWHSLALGACRRRPIVPPPKEEVAGGREEIEEEEEKKKKRGRKKEEGHRQRPTLGLSSTIGQAAPREGHIGPWQSAPSPGSRELGAEIEKRAGLRIGLAQSTLLGPIFGSQIGPDPTKEE